MTKNKSKIDFFGDGMSIFLSYINRQYKKNHEYRPHPIIRAFECAFQALEKVKMGECAMGVSQDGTETSAFEPYVVVLEKKANRIEVKEIRNIKVNKQLPQDVMILIFRLQMQLDKIKGDTVNPQEAVEALNEIIPGNRFYALGDRWKEARDKFKKLLENGKIHMPPDPEIIEELKGITYDTPWETYSNRLRSLIGSSIAEGISGKEGTVIITSPKDSKIEKFKVFDIASEFMLGKVSAYMRPFENRKT
jgi:hypothetical protein